MTSVSVLTFIGEILREGYNIGELKYVKDQLFKADLTINAFLKYYETIDHLEKQGIFSQDLMIINNLSRSYGGIRGIHTALEKYGNIDAITKTEILARNNLSFTQSEFSKLEARMITLKPFVDFAETLINDFSFNRESLDLLVKITSKYGSLTNLLEALTEYNSIHELRLAKLSEINIGRNIKNLTDASILEYIDKQDLVRKAYIEIGEINANYAKSLQLKRTQDLLTNPSEADMKSREFLRITIALLTGMLEYIDRKEERKERTSDWGRIRLGLESARVHANNLLLGF